MKKKELIDKKQYALFVQQLQQIKLNSTKGKECKGSNSISKICNPVSGHQLTKLSNKGQLIKQILHL